MASVKTALSSMSSRYQFPIIVILGSTGVGKTKLSIELAKRLNGEIISADSMQVYKGLDIITAKATLEERKECKHHMIDEIDPLENFSVVKFRNMALPVIEDISNRGKLPIIVGGTNYYIEAILWDILVTEGNNPDNAQSAESCSDSGEDNPSKIEIGSTEGEEPAKKERLRLEVVDNEAKKGIRGDLSVNSNTDGKEEEGYYEALKRIDPKAASQIHPNDVRKVKRQLQIQQLTGQLPSDLILKQHSKEGADHLGGPLRFTNALVFWLTCEQLALKKRLCNRVNEMLANGLVEEISNFYKNYNATVTKKSSDYVPYTEGIFQAIGFKEFHDYLTKETENDDEKQKLLVEGIEKLKRITIRYSKKQKTWVKNRFLKRPMHSSPNVYELDTSVVEKWNETALEPAIKAAEKFLNGEHIELEPLERQPRDPDEDTHKHYVCKACGDKLIVGDSVWKKHCESRKHKKRVAKKRKLDQDVS